MTPIRTVLRWCALICVIGVLAGIGLAACGVSIDNCEQQKDCRK